MRILKLSAIGLALACLMPFAASAQMLIATATSVISDDGGQFSAEKHVDVYDDGGGVFRYVYRVTSISGDAICRFTVNVADTNVNTATSSGAGVVPQSITIDPTQTVFQFSDVANPFNCIHHGGVPGAVSQDLVITSSFGPGGVGDTITVSLSSFQAFDEDGECLGPVVPPVVGTPTPCTIGFWKNRADGKQGTLQHFPGSNFDDVVAAALVLSMGVFTSADETGCPGNFDDLLCALGSKGKRSAEERARQQLSATLLNLAAGDLYENDDKCALFEENPVDSNACGDDITVGEAVTQVKADLSPGDDASHHEALECADDLNNGIGL